MKNKFPLEYPEKVIARRRLPARLPLFQSLVVWLVLDRAATPIWVDAVLWTLLALIWVAAIYGMATEEETDPFE